MELLCDLFLPVVQSQASEEHDTLTAVYRANGVCFAGNAVVAMTSQQQWRHSHTAADAVAGTPTSAAAEYSTESAEGARVAEESEDAIVAEGLHNHISIICMRMIRAVVKGGGVTGDKTRGYLLY